MPRRPSGFAEFLNTIAQAPPSALPRDVPRLGDRAIAAHVNRLLEGIDAAAAATSPAQRARLAQLAADEFNRAIRSPDAALRAGAGIALRVAFSALIERGRRH